VLEKKPDDTKVLFNVATIHYNAGEYDQAISNFQKLVAIDSSYTNAYFNMGNAFLLKKVPIDMALDSLRDESGEYLKDEKSTVRIEELTRKKEEFLASAQVALEKVVELDTIDLEAQILLAQVYQEQENFDQALFILEPLIQRDSTNCSALEQLAIIYAKKGMGEKAKATWKKAQDCMESQK
jgi:tetratricopeptide (TPR) repeat protein